MENIKDRIIRLISDLNLSSGEFADSIDVQRPRVSHILSGRNNPSLDFIEKIKLEYPQISLDWLILGKGNIYESPHTPEKSAEKTFNLSPTLPFEEFNTEKEEISPAENPIFEEKIIEPENIPVKLSKILLIYSDNTFEEILAKNKK